MAQEEAPGFEIAEEKEREKPPLSSMSSSKPITEPSVFTPDYYRSYIEEYAKKIIEKPPLAMDRAMTPSRLSYHSFDRRTTATPGMVRPKTISPIGKFINHN
jgi:hypothetical protein